MANIRLSGGRIVGNPTTSRDVVTVGTDTSARFYTLDTLAGNDSVNLTGFFKSSYYTISTGAGADTITGGRGTFYDGAGNDKYNIKADAIVYAGSGNDIYSVGDSTGTILDVDTIVFLYAPDQRTVLNNQNISVDLRKTTSQNLGVFGTDTLLGFENIYSGGGNDKLIGDSAENQISGGAGNDAIFGNGSNDVLRGEAGNDSISGGTGQDILHGDNGSDRLNGGIGGDRFFVQEFGSELRRDVIAYSSKLDAGRYSSSAQATRVWDEISGFDKGGSTNDDIIDLSRIDTSSLAGDQSFQFIGSAAFGTTAAWQVRLAVVQTGTIPNSPSTIIQIDTDSDAQAEMSIVVFNVTGLTVADFIL
jgi:Ca2+-binding RTX toxin-like protein